MSYLMWLNSSKKIIYTSMDDIFTIKRLNEEWKKIVHKNKQITKKIKSLQSQYCKNIKDLDVIKNKISKIRKKD